MIEKGIPGEGNILVFDNGVPPLSKVYKVGISRVIEINPVTDEIVWQYDNGYRFFGAFTCNAERRERYPSASRNCASSPY